MALSWLSIIVLFALIAVFVRNWRAGLILVMVMAGAGLFLKPIHRSEINHSQYRQEIPLPPVYPSVDRLPVGPAGGFGPGIHPVNSVYGHLVELLPACSADNPPATPMMLPSESIEAPELLPDIWKPGGIADQRPADLYPTREAAARGLGLKLAIEQIGAENPVLIQVVGRVDHDLITWELLQALAEGLRVIYPGSVEVLAETEMPDGAVHMDDSGQGVSIRVSNRITSSISNSRLGTTMWLTKVGTLVADLTGPQGKTSQTALYRDLLWMNDFESYCRLYGETRWALTQSTDACANQDEAIGQALANLGRRLCQLPGNGEFADVEQNLKKRRGIVDHFVQRIEGESGPIWRAAVLVRLNDLMGVAPAESVPPTDPVISVNRMQAMPPTWFALFGLIILIVVTGAIIKALAYSGTGRPAGSSRHNALMLIGLVPLLGVALFLVMRLTTFAHR